ncbi:MAG TPA: TolC family protein [Cyclobacteriaceae bacterium]|nr:TolC family protein [Cyclobacteriaceae bacterium]
MSRLMCAVILIFSSWLVYAQEAASENNADEVLSLDQFYELILKHHPVAQQINLLSEVAQQNIRLARGSFDPQLKMRYNAKELGNTEYYNMFGAGLDFTSIIPVHPQIGFEQNRGQYLNPEKFISPVDNFRQVYADVRIPLAQGFMTDERRTALRQAEYFAGLLEAEQVRLVNNLLLNAAKDYWNWSFAHQLLRLNERAVNISQEIFDRVKMDFQLGEASVIDTVQSFITLQTRIVELQESIREQEIKRIQISNYLWSEDLQPLLLDQNIVPAAPMRLPGISLEDLNTLIDLAQSQHPELRVLDANLLQLDAERRLNNEYLKPRIMFNYNFINQPIDGNGEFNSFSLGRNYSTGIDLSFPVFLRKERSQLALTKLKISEVNFKRSQLEREILNEIKQIYNALVNDALIIGQQEKMVVGQERLLQAEILNLESGESDLFRINFQQERLILVTAKLIKLRTDYEKLLAELYWAAGVERLAALGDN